MHIHLLESTYLAINGNASRGIELTVALPVWAEGEDEFAVRVENLKKTVISVGHGSWKIEEFSSISKYNKNLIWSSNSSLGKTSKNNTKNLETCWLMRGSMSICDPN